MKNLFSKKLICICILLVFVFSNTVYASQKKTISLGKSAETATELSLNNTYLVNVQTGDELWFKIDPSEAVKNNTHISVETNKDDNYVSMFYSLDKAKKLDSHLNYTMIEKKLMYPIAWDGKEYYGKISISQTGTLKLNLSSKKFPASTYYIPQEYPDENWDENACPLETLSQDNVDISKMLNSIRGVRDNLLSKSELGKEVTKVYYKASKNITMPLIVNSKLRNQLTAELSKIKPAINSIIEISSGKKSKYVLSSKDIQSLNKIKDIIIPLLDKDMKNELNIIYKKLELSNYINKPLQSFVNTKLSLSSSILKNSFIVTTSKDVDISKLKTIITKSIPSKVLVNVKEEKNLFNSNEKLFIVSLNENISLDSFKNQLTKNSTIKSIEENLILNVSNSSTYESQWGLENNGPFPVREIWEDKNGRISSSVAGNDINFKNLENLLKGKELKNIPIAVIDSGITPDLADFKGNVDLEKGFNFLNNTNDVIDDLGHGTHVSGIIGAKSNNNYSMTGINQYATIIPIKMINQYGMGDTFTLAKSIKHAVDNGAKVINLSLGFLEKDMGPLNPEKVPYVEKALKYAYDKNVTVIAASGNEYMDGFRYPANSKYTISVGAITYNGKRAEFSNYGKDLDLVAPGEFIASLIPSGEVFCDSGTSMATPMVSAAVGLLYSVDPNMTPDKAREILHKTSKDLGKEGFDEEYGYGCLDVTKAVGMAIGK